MKILRLIHSANPRGGGPIMGITLSSRILIERGHEITLISLDDPSEAKEYELPGKFIALGPSKTSYGYCPKLSKWLDQNIAQFDVVIIHGLWQYHGFAAWCAMRKLGDKAPPYFVFTHGMLDPWFKRTYPLKHIKKWLYWPWGEYRVLRDAKAVLFTSEEEKLLARESFWLYRAREVVVGYGTQLPSYSLEEMNDAWRQLCPAKQSQPYLLYLGRLHIKKGADLLIQAYRELKTNGQTLPDLILAGPEQDADFTHHLKKLAAGDSQIHFVGMVSGAAKWGALANAEAMVLPSHQENFGIVVAEALAMGAPALISNKVNIWREVQEDGAGLVSNDDAAGAKQLLTDFCALKETERVSMRIAAKACFQKRFELDSAIGQLISTITP